MTGLSDAAVRRLRGLGDRRDEVVNGRYRVIEELGRGGMGIVYLAADTWLDREVALKVASGPVSEELERRLQLEARALARLEHPGIVPIHDAGRLPDGRLFYVMRRIHGRTLRDHRPHLTDEGARLLVFERLCDPVAFAHARGVLHRDLKPDNVMLGAFGEVIVMDWGIAKRLDAPGAADGLHATGFALSGTAAGTVLGTHGFMSPEQARGEAAAVDEQTDIYSLGAILFFLLAGEPPPAPDAAAAIARRTDLPPALRAICARAVAAEPAARYPSVTALADDVARYRAHRPVEAHREGLLDRARRLGRAHRAAILLVLAYVLMRALVALLTGR